MIIRRTKTTELAEKCLKLARGGGGCDCHPSTHVEFVSNRLFLGREEVLKRINLKTTLINQLICFTHQIQTQGVLWHAYSVYHSFCVLLLLNLPSMHVKYYGPHTLCAERYTIPFRLATANEIDISHVTQDNDRLIFNIVTITTEWSKAKQIDGCLLFYVNHRWRA